MSLHLCSEILQLFFYRDLSHSKRKGLLSADRLSHHRSHLSSLITPGWIRQPSTAKQPDRRQQRIDLDLWTKRGNRRMYENICTRTGMDRRSTTISFIYPTFSKTKLSDVWYLQIMQKIKYLKHRGYYISHSKYTYQLK